MRDPESGTATLPRLRKIAAIQQSTPFPPKAEHGQISEFARGYWIVNSATAEVLRQFDLGDGALYPVEVRKSDAITPFEGEWYTWIFGNRKETANFEVSHGLREFSSMPDDPWRKLPFKPADGDLAVSRKALEGADVWVEKNLFQSVFVSAALGNALKSADLARAFRLAKARVV